MNGTPLTIGTSSVAAPQLDDDTTTALEEALETLRLLRHGETYHSADRLTALASIALAAQKLIPDAIADAVEQGFTWDQIAHRAAISNTAISNTAISNTAISNAATRRRYHRSTRIPA